MIVSVSISPEYINGTIRSKIFMKSSSSFLTCFNSYKGLKLEGVYIILKKGRDMRFNALFVLFIMSIFCVRSTQAATLKVSVIVPCYYKHAQHLVSLLELYEQQVVLPDDVVISISEVHKVEPYILKELETRIWKFPVKVLMSEQVKYAGENRNIACANAIGDIFICQDADDVPHPQRVQIIKYFFENYKVDHLMHGHFELDGKKEVPSFPMRQHLESIVMYWNQEVSKIREKLHCHHGNSAISKELFKKIQWSSKPRGQDIEFNRKVYARKYNCLCIRVPLLGYRYFLSSAPKLNRRIQRDLALEKQNLGSNND